MLASFGRLGPRPSTGLAGLTTHPSHLPFPPHPSESTETVFYGHTTFTPVLANGSLSTNASDVKCLGATYAYVGDTPALQECSASDDSGQFLLTWQLEIVPSDDAAFNGTTILSFVGPAGSVAS